MECNNDRLVTDWARLTLEKESGKCEWNPKIKASRPEAALKGIACLVAEYASLTGRQVFEVLSRLTVVLLAPGIGEEAGETYDG